MNTSSNTKSLQQVSREHRKQASHFLIVHVIKIKSKNGNIKVVCGNCRIIQVRAAAPFPYARE